MQRVLVNAEGWWVLYDEKGEPVDGFGLTRFTYQASTWSNPHWLVGIRQHIVQRAHAKRKTLDLFADDPGPWPVTLLGLGDRFGLACHCDLAHIPGARRSREPDQRAEAGLCG